MAGNEREGGIEEGQEEKKIAKKDEGSSAS